MMSCGTKSYKVYSLHFVVFFHGIHSICLMCCPCWIWYEHCELNPYHAPVVIQLQFSGNPVCLELRPQCTLECHWRNIVGSQCVSIVLSVVLQCVPIMQIKTRLPLRHNGVLASASLVTVASQCTCSSCGLPLSFNYANDIWIAAGRLLGDSISQCRSSVVCPVVSQCTESVWFIGGHKVRSLPNISTISCVHLVFMDYFKT